MSGVVNLLQLRRSLEAAMKALAALDEKLSAALESASGETNALREELFCEGGTVEALSAETNALREEVFGEQGVVTSFDEKLKGCQPDLSTGKAATLLGYDYGGDLAAIPFCDPGSSEAPVKIAATTYVDDRMDSLQNEMYSCLQSLTDDFLSHLEHSEAQFNELWEQWGQWYNQSGIVAMYRPGQEEPGALPEGWDWMTDQDGNLISVPGMPSLALIIRV